MKRRISLVIALFVSFLLMFSPIAGADETKLPTVTTSEPIEVEVAKIPRDTNKADKADSPPQEKFDEVPVLDYKSKPRGPCVQCPDGRGPGHWMTTFSGAQYCIVDCSQ